MKDLDYMDAAERVMAQIRKGAFLTVKAAGGLNTMTIGWATFGVVWQRPVMMVAVRASRHTFGLMERAADFTVSVPPGGMEKELAYCGTKSGRDFDKFKECGLTVAPGRVATSPVIDIPGIHFECRTLYKAPMVPDAFDGEYRHSVYPEGDFHSFYFGEIEACYETP